MFLFGGLLDYSNRSTRAPGAFNSKTSPRWRRDWQTNHSLCLGYSGTSIPGLSFGRRGIMVYIYMIGILGRPYWSSGTSSPIRRGLYVVSMLSLCCVLHVNYSVWILYVNTRSWSQPFYIFPRQPLCRRANSDHAPAFNPDIEIVTWSSAELRNCSTVAGEEDLMKQVEELKKKLREVEEEKEEIGRGRKEARVRR